MKALLKTEEGTNITWAEIQPTENGTYPEAIIFMNRVYVGVVRRDKNPEKFLLYKRVSTAHI